MSQPKGTTRSNPNQITLETSSTAPSNTMSISNAMKRLTKPAGVPYSGQIFYQVLDAKRADAVIDTVDALVCKSLPALLGEAANDDDANLNLRVKSELNRRLQDSGILITRVQLSAS